MRAAKPDNELERLAALRSFDILDTPPEEAFDRLTRAASRVFDAPVCLVSLLDDERQYFKSHLGTPLTETSRDISFCSHAILGEGPLVVCDPASDPRFADSDLVTGELLSVKFYAGAPLTTKDGHKIGALCVLDTVDHVAPSAEQIGTLEDLSAQVVELLEARKVRHEVLALRTDLDAMRQQLFTGGEQWRRTEQTAALALDAGKMGFWDWNAHQNKALWSERLFGLMGFPLLSSAPALRQWLKRILPDERHLLLKTLRTALRSRASFCVTCRLLDINGVEHSITSAGTPYFDERGALLGALGVVWDTTERDRQERAMAESAGLFQGLSSSCPVGIFVANLDGNCIFANQRLAQIFGSKGVGALLVLDWLNHVHPDDVQETRRVWLESVAQRKPFHYEYRVVQPDESVRWVLARAAIIHAEDGQATGFVGTVDDITERRRTLLELHAAKNSAEQANRSKDLFLANVSHELRTPLNGVLGMTDLLLETALTGEQREMAEIARDSGHSLLMVVNDILDLSRIEAGKLAIENAPFDCNGMLRQTLALIEHQARKKGLTLELKQLRETPASFIGDAGRIKQILLVYLTNAIKFTANGGVVVDVVADMHSETECGLLFAVRDTGPGIGFEEQMKLFRPFSQVDPSSTRRHGGVGLGLAIARRLAELMHGSVGVLSSPGEGATFWLRLSLPLAAVAKKPESGITKAAEAASARILVVEDHPVNQIVAVSALRRLGWETDVASNGLTAVELVRTNNYAVVLMDCQMPELDGYDATKRIRAYEASHNLASVPIIALTAHAMTGDRELCLDAGMNDYLTKPFGLEELRAALLRWSSVSPAKSPAGLQPVTPR